MLRFLASVAAAVSLAACLVACRDDQVDPCLADFQVDSGDDRSRTVTLSADDVDEHLVLGLVVPWEHPRYDDGAPVAVFVHGGWRTDAVPVTEESLGHLEHDEGIATIYLNLPGGTGDLSSSGTNDRRGAGARQAVAATLRYAAGLEPDNGGCTIGERIPGGRADPVVLASFSNGGNLAWATLGDPDLDLPEVAGVATFETPAAGQFVTAETGTEDNPSPLYTPGACALTDGPAIACDYGYAGLAWDPAADEGGVLFIDEDDNERYAEDTDFALGAVLSTDDGGSWMQSAPARLAAEDLGVDLSSRGSVADTVTFWDEREAPRAMPAAVARFPSLAAIESGTEVDHVLSGATDHPHVTGMVAAMQRAGVAWTRLHPDAAYAAAVSGADWDFADLPANTAVSVGDLTRPMEPEDDSEVRGTHYLTAAVVELMDRTRVDEWEPDLDDILVP